MELDSVLQFMTNLEMVILQKMYFMFQQHAMMVGWRVIGVTVYTIETQAKWIIFCRSKH